MSPGAPAVPLWAIPHRVASAGGSLRPLAPEPPSGHRSRRQPPRVQRPVQRVRARQKRLSRSRPAQVASAQRARPSLLYAAAAGGRAAASRLWAPELLEEALIKSAASTQLAEDTHGKRNPLASASPAGPRASGERRDSPHLSGCRLSAIPSGFGADVLSFEYPPVSICPCRASTRTLGALALPSLPLLPLARRSAVRAACAPVGTFCEGASSICAR